MPNYILKSITKKIKIKNKVINYYSIINYNFNKFRFKAVSHPRKIIWVNPNIINFNLKQLKDFKYIRGGILDGDWDLGVKNFNDRDKHLSVKQHFIQGVDWKDTLIFKNKYLKNIKNGKKARSYTSKEGLLKYYENDIKKIYISMKENGFKVPGKQMHKDEMYVYIGRDGSILLGKNGNHRLSIAKILKIDKIPVRVKIRHMNWQVKRELVSASRANDKNVDDDYLKHPDMQDLI